ncbi:MAG TPA: response regulator [Opitutaceae bacterium]|nr:response regulator [Opitutaceae bacterium]
MPKETFKQDPVPGEIAAAPVPAPSKPDESAPMRLGARVPLRILAADDVRTNRELIRQLTGYFGFEAEIVENGAEVLAALSRRSFDLILLDVQMPVMDGLETAREIVRLHPEPGWRPKMVALTANSLAADREAYLAVGMDDCLAKPISPKALEACIFQLFTAAPSSEMPTLHSVPPIKPAEPPLVDFMYLETAIPGVTGPKLAAIQQRMHRAVTRDFETIWPQIVEACSRQDQGQLAGALHALKGCFSTVGWSRITGRCAEELPRARAQQFSEWSTLPAELQQLYAASTAEMTRYLAAVDPVESAAPMSKDQAETNP